MRAPTAVPVDFPLGPERRWQLWLTAAFVLCLLTQVLWWLAQAGATTPTSTLFMAVLLSLLSTPLIARALWHLRRPQAHMLRWTGLTWQLIAPDRPPRVAHLGIAMDLDRWLLLRLRELDGPDLWLPMAAAQMPDRWHALRCALADPGAPDVEVGRDLAA